MDFRGSVDTSVRIGVLEAQDTALWVWSGPSLPVQLLAECTGMVRLLASHLTSLMWLGVVSCTCHTHTTPIP